MSDVSISFPQDAALRMQQFQKLILSILNELNTRDLNESQLVALYGRFQGHLTELNAARLVPNAIEYMNAQHPTNYGIDPALWTYDVRVPFAEFEAAIPSLIGWFIVNLPEHIDATGALIENPRPVDTTSLKTIAADLISKSP